VVGNRLKFAGYLKSKAYDIVMIALIVVYTLIVLLQFGLEETVFAKNPRIEEVFFIIELVILGIFVVEILLHLYAFGKMYLEDYWNISDIVVIFLSIVFVLLDIEFGNQSGIAGILKLRGLFRLLRVFLLIRKLNLVRVRREVRKKIDFDFTNDMRAPVEKVIEILSNHRDILIAEDAEQSQINELNYCISMVQSDKLYEADFELDEKSDKGGRKSDALNWISTYSHNVANRVNGQKRDSVRFSDSQSSIISPSRKRGSKFGKNLVSENIFTKDPSSLPIDQILKLSPEAQEALEKIEENSFDIFKVREATQDNELLVASTYILHKN